MNDKVFKALADPSRRLLLDRLYANNGQTLSELCRSAGIEPPALPAQKRYSSFGAFMDVITACHAVLSSPESLWRIIDEIVEDAAADGAVWVELSLWPGLFEGRLGSERTALAVALEAGNAAGARHGIGFGLMVAANHHAGPEAATATARLAVKLAGVGVVSFGLDGFRRSAAASCRGRISFVGSGASIYRFRTCRSGLELETCSRLGASWHGYFSATTHGGPLRQGRSGSITDE